MSQQWWVYMVQTQSGKLYTGISTDVARRFEQHQCMKRTTKPSIESPTTHKLTAPSRAAGNKGAKFFYSDPAVSVVYREACDNRSEASKREAQIKKLNRKAKCQLAGLMLKR